MSQKSNGQNSVKKLYTVLNLYRSVPAAVLYALHKDILKKDAEKYLKYTPYEKVSFMMFFYTLLRIKPFRSVFYMRVKKRMILSAVSKIFIKPLDSIELITDKIGPGLLLLHNMGCIVNARSAGCDLTVAQGVTVGTGNRNDNGEREPILGDNVHIATNAVVFGGITIGSNVKIGAGCILNKSVPDNCVVVGNPARIIKRDGVSCNEPL